MQIKVHQLKIGDVLKGSGEKVIYGPVDGILCPRGKVRLGLEKNDKQRWIYWNKSTKVNIQD